MKLSLDGNFHDAMERPSWISRSGKTAAELIAERADAALRSLWC